MKTEVISCICDSSIKAKYLNVWGIRDYYHLMAVLPKFYIKALGMDKDRLGKCNIPIVKKKR